jgi:serine/threonine-protein kinase
MPIDAGQCDETRIARFLNGELDAAAQADFESHLDACPACQGKLDASTADGDTWRRIGDCLRDEPLDMESLSELLTTSDEGELTKQVLDDGVRRVVELLSPTDEPNMLGRIGGYEVSGVIGSGGNGIVLKAHDRALNRYVAIKVLTPHLAGSGAARNRFAREAQAAAAVVHENVIAIHGVSESGRLPFLVMPYVRGASLQRRIDEQGPLGLSEVLRIGMQTAAGLAAAHAQGLVHRDIKPGNILLADGVERVTITDFGLARAVDDASMTRSGIIAGTPLFMSPEQARGEATDHRSDLFSLGSVLYTMCAGHPPFRSETSYGVLRRICEAHPRPLRESNTETPPWLANLIARLHEKDPKQRFQTAAEVAELLSQCLAHVQQPQAQPLPSALRESRAKPRVQRTRLVVAVLSSALLGLAALAAVLFPFLRSLPPGSGRPELQAPAEYDVPAEDVSAAEQELEWDDHVAETLLEVQQDVERLDASTQRLLTDSVTD